VLGEVRRDPKVMSSDLVSVSPGVIKGVVESHECVGCRAAVGIEAFIVDARMDDRGRMVQRLIAQDRDAVKRILDRLEKRGHRVELRRLTTFDVDELLTTRQEDVVEMAWEMGYFDRPRRTGLREMAGALGVSISTMSEILRKAQRKIMEDRFGADGEGSKR
jgi:predicted DNA binding protein